MAAPKTTKPASVINPIKIYGEFRTCRCGSTVRRGIMWETLDLLHCSRNCANTTRHEWELENAT